MTIKTLCAVQALVLLALAGCGSSRSVTATQSPASATADSAGSSEATTNSTDPLLAPSPDIPSDREDANKRKAPTALPDSADETDRASNLQKQEAARSKNSAIPGERLKGGGPK